MFSTAYSARSDKSAVSAPGPAISGNATGTMLAPLPRFSFLMISRPRIISTASTNSTNEPATANEALSMPNNFNKASPAKKNARNNPKAVRQACIAFMGFPLSFKLRNIGIEPRMSMIANITINELKTSMKSNCPKNNPICSIVIICYRFNSRRFLPIYKQYKIKSNVTRAALNTYSHITMSLLYNDLWMMPKI